MVYIYLSIVFVVFIATVLFLYLDHVISNKKIIKKTWLKILFMNTAISVLVAYFLIWLSPKGNIKELFQKGGNSVLINTGKPLINISEIGESIIGGEAPF
jgi:hypothetical protein